MEHFWQTVEGFFSQPECDFLQTQIDRVSSPAHFVEVGSWKGRSSSFMAVAIHNSGKSIKFDCVDTWEGSDEIAHANDEAVKTGTLRDVFERNMKPVEGLYTAVQLPSVAAAAQYEDKSLDFVFLDASHDYENVVADILAWLPKVKAGGVIGGHDALHPPIVAACADTVGAVQLNPARDCWYKFV